MGDNLQSVSRRTSSMGSEGDGMQLLQTMEIKSTFAPEGQKQSTQKNLPLR